MGSDLGRLRMIRRPAAAHSAKAEEVVQEVRHWIRSSKEAESADRSKRLSS